MAVTWEGRSARGRSSSSSSSLRAGELKDLTNSPRRPLRRRLLRSLVGLAVVVLLLLLGLDDFVVEVVVVSLSVVSEVDGFVLLLWLWLLLLCFRAYL